MATALDKSKGRLAGLTVYSKTLLQELDRYVSSEDCEQAKLLGLRNTVSSILEQLAVVHNEIINMLEPKDIEAAVVEHMTALQPSYHVLAKVDLKLAAFNSLTPVNTLGASSGNNIQAQSTAVQCRLPKMQLPEFSGDPLAWQGFWDQFQVAIHNNTRISDIDKFNYLKGCLKGESLSVVSGLSLSSDNYQEAVGILKDRFGNEQILISAHMESLLRISKIASRDNIKGLRMLYNHVESCVRNLKSLKLDTSGYGSLLIPILKDRLPDEITMIISRKFGEEIWTLDKVMEYFNSELRAQENCSASTSSRSIPNESHRKGGNYTTSGLFGQTNKVACVYCSKEGHSSSKCSSVSNCQSRKAILRRNKRCFICLDTGHIAKNCKSHYLCRKCKNGKHHISICEQSQADFPSLNREEDKNATSDNKGFVVHANCDKSGILLQTARADILPTDDSVQVQTRILFDSGSQRSYISDKVRSALKLKAIRVEKVVIKTFGQAENSEVQGLDVVQLKIRNKSDARFTFVEALCVPTICSPLTNQPLSSVHELPEFAGLEFADFEHTERQNLPVGILIGIDFYHVFMSGKIVRSKLGPVASKTRVGWVLSGRIGSTATDMHCFETHLLRASVEQSEKDTSLQQELEKFWNVESIGTKTDSIVDQFKNDIIHDGTRYITKLPFKPDHEVLPDNFKVCEGRLKSLKNKLITSNILHDYDQIFSEYEENGIIERVPSDEVARETGQVHYLPHRPVIRNDKQTTKIRAVFDASCKVSGPSLNECLYSGPNLIAKIFDILLRFRLNKIGILADIKQAFLNVGIDAKHRDYLRFLWYDLQTEDEQVVIYRFLRVVFGITSSPFLLNGTIRHHLSKYLEKEIAQRVIDDLYVDDLVSGCNRFEEGQALYDRSKAILSEAGFDLRKWVTNDKELAGYIASKENGDGNLLGKDNDMTYFEATSPNITVEHQVVLGVGWDTTSDEFIFRFDDLISKCATIKHTKRNILSISASIFDPLGFIAPVTAKIKTIFQLLCKDKLDWDEIIPEKIADVWTKFVEELKRLAEVRHSRFVLTSHFSSGSRFELHGFCDSSKEVYCAVVYLRIVYQGAVHVCFLASKTKVAPLKTLTIPRLELLGCLLLSKLIREVLQGVEKRIDLHDIFCWTDSEVALCWVNGKEKSWEPWVENRVVAIRKVVDREKWHFVKGAVNPADIPTRLSSNLNDSFTGCWFKGPLMLWSRDLEVDRVKGSCGSGNSLVGRVDVEIPAEVVNFSNTTEKGTPNNSRCSINAVIDCTRYSSLKKMILTTGYVMRFVNNLKKRYLKKRFGTLDDDIVNDSVLTVDEYNKALEMWIKEEQTLMKEQANYTNLCASLRLFEDKIGLMRLKGRFANSSLEYEEQHPVILRSKDNSYFTRLIILDAHEATMHHGIETTLARIRKNYWIVKGRKSVKEVIRKCVVCTRYQGLPVRAPSSPDLPEYRVDHMAYAFQFTGLDFAGPLFIKDGLKNEKSYILLLTCASSRAIHLELVPDMSIHGFLRGFKRFVARRGVPDFVISDNFKTFRSSEVKKFMILQGIRQRFILPASPWWGGFYERLVRTVKSCLKKTLGKAFVTFEELQTILCDIEVAVNNRPLAYVSEDDLDEALTPFHLMHGRSISTGKQFKSVDCVVISSLDGCKQRLHHLRKVLQDFWNRFRTDYLNELRQMNLYRKIKGNNNNNNITVDDVVLIKDDEPAPRTQWRIGRVLELVRGRDGQVRGARLKVLSKAGKQSSVHRPVQRLIPFEIREKSAVNSEKDVDEEKDSEEDVVPEAIVNQDDDGNARPRRKAAIEGQTMRRIREHYT